MALDEKAWETVKELFATAQEVDSEHRAEFLSGTISDPEVRAEVQRLLAEYDKAGDFLSTPAMHALRRDYPQREPPNLGSSISHYRILGRIGGGGMGEVYRAHDPRLGREVAVKILPESFANDAARLRRFEQEARSVAALNHPNILSVHDVGSQGTTHYIVTELLEGESLREKLSRGPLSPRRATDYAVQLAKGLAAAHEKGIIHRDLKPENLFVTKDERAKILDFGLAKPVMTMPGGSSAPTAASAAPTSAGMVLGTVGYMAPEQVRGETVDHRADLFAFGTVLYEMLSGHRAFQKNSSVETMAAILNDDPPELTVGEEGQIPPALERIVRRCLEKSREQRFQSARDLGFALENISTVTSRQSKPLAASQQPNRWRVLALVLGILALVALAIATRGLLRPTQLPDYRQITFRTGYILSARFLPDGQTILYNAAWDGPSNKLYTARSDGKDVRTLDLPPSDLLAVSHSGELAITLHNVSGVGGARYRLATVSVLGGAPRELLDNVAEADWSPDGTRLAVVRAENGKHRLEYPVGTSLYETISWITHMRVSPQGDAIAFMEHPLPGDDRGSVVLVDLQGKKRTLTTEWPGEQGLAWTSDGREVWFTATNTADTNRSLYGVSRSGKQRLILRAPGGMYLEDIAPDGRVLLSRHDRRYEVVVGETGGKSRWLSWLPIMLGASVSRDGTYAVLGDWGSSSDYDVYLAKLDGSPAVLLGHGVAGSISPDNK